MYIVAKRLDGVRCHFMMELGFYPGHIVLDGAPAPAQKGHSPQFSAHVYCDQTARWTMIPLGTEVGRGLSVHTTLCYMGPRSPHLKKAQPPLLGPCLLWPNVWMDQDATWYEGTFQPRPHCVTWGSNSPKRGTAPNFRPMSIVAKLSPISATGEYTVLVTSAQQ